MKKIPIAEATNAQLRKHCELVLGLELPKVANDGALKAKIEAAAPGTTEILVEEEVSSPAQTEAEQQSSERAVAASHAPAQRMSALAERLKGKSPKEAASHHYDPRIEIMIPQSPLPGGERDVQVPVNGNVWLLKRDEWHVVPYRVFEALSHAKETHYTPTNDDMGRLTVAERDVYSYPFQTRNEPSEEEVKEWQERTSSIELT